MSLYYEAAEVLTAPSNQGGSLRSRIFNKKDLKSQPAQVYALAIETCKWSPILKEVIENADLLRLELKLTSAMSLLLVHDLLLAKRGVALPATHGLRASVERHRGRLTSELTKARLRRKMSTIEVLKAHVETGQENVTDTSEAPYPRWIRINTLKTTLEDQLESTFTGFERAATINAVRHRGSKRLYIDVHIPNLIAISPNTDLSKSEAYKSGAIIFQDKASCFPAYLLDPLAEDGNIIDSCAAPGNKTTHIAAILVDRLPAPEESTQVIHAFEKNKGRAETLDKMVTLAGSNAFTTLHAEQDFLKTDPNSRAYKNVGALLLDPSCSGSGIVGRDDMPELHLPGTKQFNIKPYSYKKQPKKAPEPVETNKKRKREDDGDALEVLVDDDGAITAVDTEAELKSRLKALAVFQLELLLHAFKYPAARKITYSTCSIHAEENESVVQKALASDIAKERGWKILRRDNQIRGMREWPIRGSVEACDGNKVIAEGCIRANKGDEHATMGFFLAGFVRDQTSTVDPEAGLLRDESGNLVRDLMGIPVINGQDDEGKLKIEAQVEPEESQDLTPEDDDEWGGIGEEVAPTVKGKKETQAAPVVKKEKAKPNKEKVKPDNEKVKINKEKVEPSKKKANLNNEKAKPDNVKVKPDNEKVKSDNEKIKINKEKVEPSKKKAKLNNEKAKPDNEKVNINKEKVKPNKHSHDAIKRRVNMSAKDNKRQKTKR
ncbi:hypothetical protein SBOR_2705 [Sclerotinia borealis F-4128]|uniref:SAM-dependent MTase RsmB/NOP-type domain-containing protein n=1 Tax=Sclerotinia borealis (strain F-4128) TaxID=1432307 RepID=W9CM67_SCLBF|nr:hypothetical protein SBOR_2705 [Sclerotinia borealis F-4128]